MNCIDYHIPSEHKVEVGFLRQRQFFGNYAVGAATREAMRAFFQLQLDLFPNNKYYIVKNDLDDNYIIYSKKKKTEDGYHFSKAIGTGEVFEAKENKTYLRILIPLLRLEVFMNCHPLKKAKEADGAQTDHNRLSLCG